MAVRKLRSYLSSAERNWILSNAVWLRRFDFVKQQLAENPERIQTTRYASELPDDAIWFRSQDLLDLFLSLGTDPNRSGYAGRPPLFKAVNQAWSTPEPVRLLLSHGAGPNARDERGESILQAAEASSSSHRDEIVRLLKKSGATQ